MIAKLSSIANLTKIVVAVALGLAAAYVYADWTAPPGSPPVCPESEPACQVPLNVSVAGQTKTGALVVGGLRSMTTLFTGDNIGIRTTTPAGDLHVVGKTAGMSVFRLQDGDNVAADASIIYDNASQLMINKRATGVAALIDISPEPLTAGQGAIVRFFRVTNAPSYTKYVQFLRGNNTTEVASQIGVDGAHTFFGYNNQGNLGVGTNQPVSKLDVVGDICWTPPGAARRCLGNFNPGDGGGGSQSWWTINSNGHIRNTNTQADGTPGQVNIQGQVRIEGGNPATGRVLVSSNNAGLAVWQDPATIGGGGGGDGIGNDVLHATFSGCTVGIGCPLQSGDSGPTSGPAPGLLNSGVLRMSCPAGYKVVSGGVDCSPSFNFGIGVKVSQISVNRPASKTAWDVQCTQTWTAFLGFAYVDYAEHTYAGIDRASVICSK